MMYRIGVISDTHGLLREEVKKELEGCGAILHGGDIHKEAVLRELQDIAPVYAVRGNADKEWAEGLPVMLDIGLFGLRAVMVHNRKELPKERPFADLLIFGHSHKYLDRWEGNIRLLNPGSCGPRRFHQPITMAVIETDGNGAYEVHRIDIAHEAPENGWKMPENRRDRRRLAEAVMRDVDKGKTIGQIAENHSISKELAEQICRMYLTHPGVDVDGILDRIGE